MPLNRYTKNVIMQRQTPDLVDPTAIQSAGGLARGIAQLADTALAFKRARDVNFVNEKSAEFERNVDDFFNDFKVTAADDPDGKREEFDGYVERTFKELSASGSPEAIKSFSRIKDDIKFKYDRKYGDFARRQNVANFGKSFASSIDNIGVMAMRAGQNGESLDEFYNKIDASLVAGGSFLSQTDLASLNKEARESVTRQYIDGLIETNPKAAKQRLDNQEFDGVLTADHIQSLGLKAERAEAFDIAQKAKEASALNKSIVDSVKLRSFQSRDINQPIGVEQSEIDDLLRDGSIDTNQYISLSKGLEDALLKRTETQSDVAMIQAFDRGDMLMDITNKSHTKAANTFYESEFLPTIAELPQEDQITEKVRFAVNKNFIPSQMKAEISANLSSGSPDAKVMAANITNDIVMQSPSLARQFNDKDIAFSAKVAEGVNAGLRPEEAVSSAESRTFLKGTPEYRTRSEIFKKEKKDFSKGEIQRLFRDDPNEVPPEMLTEWNTLYRFYSVDQGVDDDKARELAYNKLQSTWGLSNVAGGLKWSKWSPEAYYSIDGVDNKWMRNQLTEIVSDALLFESDDAVQDFIDNNVELIPDMRTVRAGEPAYTITTKRETKDGNIVFDVIRNQSGQEIFWRPDFSETREAQEMAKKHHERVSEIKDKFINVREKNLDRLDRFGFIPQDEKVLQGARGESVIKSVKEGF